MSGDAREQRTLARQRGQSWRSQPYDRASKRVEFRTPERFSTIQDIRDSRVVQVRCELTASQLVVNFNSIRNDKVTQILAKSKASNLAILESD